MNKILVGDCLIKLKELEDNSVDSIVTDPPYHLVSIVKRFGKENSAPAKFGTDGAFSRASKGFMGKDWDGVNEEGIGIAQKVELWKECLRVLKPGGHLLAFSGTRTYHRMASAIEDAGFEVRDMIEWVYGSGFPKSLNIGKAVDKLQGNERELVGINKNCGNDNSNGESMFGIGAVGKEVNITKGTSEYEGWGTALKPAHESIAVAQKPFDTRSDIDYTISICQTLFAQIVKNSSELNLSEKTQQSIAQWIAEKNINTLEDLSEVMDMLQLELETNLNLSIVSSWLNILGEIWGAMSMFTTETKGSLTTELKILQSLEWENIFQNITQVKNNQTNGYSANVLNVENLLNAVKLKLKYILTHSAQENAILQANKLNFAPNHEPICMARKPLAEKTVAENVLKYGTGGINIDESRVDTITEADKNNFHQNRKVVKEYKADDTLYELGMKTVSTAENPQGRFPANLIHDNSEEVRECFPETKSVSGGRSTGRNFGQGENEGGKDLPRTGHDDSGNASRFFKSIIYQAKASKSERNKGCEELQEKEYTMSSTPKRQFIDGVQQAVDFTTKPLSNKNNHPTVKPIALMEYLIKMVTKPGGIVLDPFAGSGSTLVAAKQNGFQYIGIELTEEYIPIIEARLK